MAAKLPLPSLSRCHSSKLRVWRSHLQPWLVASPPKRLMGRRVSAYIPPDNHIMSSSSSMIGAIIQMQNQLHHDGGSPSSSSLSSAFELADSAVGYSTASYYTSLGLFVISVPGLWSLIKRSVKSKVVKKTFIALEGEEGESVKTKNKAPNQVAGEILSFFTRNNFAVVDKGETITNFDNRDAFEEICKEVNPSLYGG